LFAFPSRVVAAFKKQLGGGMCTERERESLWQFLSSSILRVYKAKEKEEKGEGGLWRASYSMVYMEE
jgi:hypothetical protein